MARDDLASPASSGGSTARRVARVLLPLWRKTIVALALSLAALGANVGLLATAGYLLAAAAMQPLLASLAFPMTAVRVLGVSRAVLRYGERLVAHGAVLAWLADMRLWLFGRLVPLAPGALARRGGDVLARLTADLEELQNLYLRVLLPLAVAALAVASIGAVLLIASPVLALVATICLLAVGLGGPLLGLALARGLGERQVAARSALHNHLVETLQGLPDLLACDQGSARMAELAALEREAGRLQRRQGWIAGLQAAWGELITGISLVALLTAAVPLTRAGHLAGVYLGCLALLLLAGFEAVQPLGVAFAGLGRSMAAARRLFELADAVPVVREPAAPLAMPLEPSLRFDAVSFAYTEADGPAVEDISLEVRAGEWVAVVGPSGAGKSTLAGLALRFWDPRGGTVLLGDRPLARYALDDVRSAFSLVSQDTTLFTDTVRGNLRLGWPQATDATCLEALRAVGLGYLPGGLDAWLGEQGLTLSGGERQRLAVARALIRQAPLLILDEATANLDTRSEADLLALLHERCAGRGVLMITHRLVAMERMREIVVLDHGRVVERGSHARLSAADGLYRQLLEAQRQVIVAP